MHHFNAEFANDELKLIDRQGNWYIISTSTNNILYKTADENYREEFFSVQGAITHATTILFPKVPTKLDKYELCQIDVEDGGVKVYSLWDIVYKIEEEHGVDFWEEHRSPDGRGIEMFIDFLVADGNMNHRTECDDVFVYDMLDVTGLVSKCLDLDMAEFKAPGWRSEFANLMLNELGPEIFISGQER